MLETLANVLYRAGFNRKRNSYMLDIQNKLSNINEIELAWANTEVK